MHNEGTLNESKLLRITNPQWELIIGPDLLDLLNEHGGRLPEPMACFYFVQLLEAITHMHENGFCHRDIKPENAMVQRSNHQLKVD